MNVGASPTAMTSNQQVVGSSPIGGSSWLSIRLKLLVRHLQQIISLLGSVAQWKSIRTFNLSVVGSNPTCIKNV